MRNALRLLQPKPVVALGIDLSITSIKILELSCFNHQYRIESYGYELLPAGVSDGVVINNVEVVAQCLRALVKKTTLFCKQFFYKHAVVAIPDSSTMSKIISVSDRLQESDLEELAVIEIEKYIPCPANEINFDFKFIGQTKDNPTMRDMLIVASRAEHVEQRVAVLRRAGLRTKVVEIESDAILRVMQYMYPDYEHVIALVDIGALSTQILILLREQILFSKQEAFGGQHQYSMPHEQFKQTLLMHIKRALQFFYSTYPACTIQQVGIAGGVAKQIDLAYFLQQNLQIATKTLNPFEQMSVASQVNLAGLTQDAPLLLTACGLAMRAC